VYDTKPDSSDVEEGVMICRRLWMDLFDEERYEKRRYAKTSARRRDLDLDFAGFGVLL
jgi:hypothetical protein